jgi:hypothetical protein
LKWKAAQEKSAKGGGIGEEGLKQLMFHPEVTKEF